MKINDLYDTDHDKAFAENIQQKCVIINQLYQALMEKDAEIEKLKEQLGYLNLDKESVNGTSKTTSTNKS